MKLRPFWSYYGGKYRAAPRYPRPVHRRIVEPFAGAAGYSLRYPDLEVVLVERNPVVAGIWRWLTTTTPAEVLRIPLVEATDDLPGWVPQGARDLVGFTLNSATTRPSRTLSAGRRRLALMGRTMEGWNEKRRAMTADQVGAVRHWQIIEGDYTLAPDVEATWFLDPPYDNSAGAHYPGPRLDYPALAAWARSRRGQVMVCENEGATWLPFQPFGVFKPGVNGAGSKESLAIL